MLIEVVDSSVNGMGCFMKDGPSPRLSIRVEKRRSTITVKIRSANLEKLRQQM